MAEILLPAVVADPATDEVGSLVRAAKAIPAVNSQIVMGLRDPQVIHSTNRTPLEQAIREVADYEGQYACTEVPAVDIRVPAGRVVAGDAELSLGETGFGNLCRSLRVPEPFALDLGPKMRNRLLQYQICRGRFADEKLAVGMGRVISRNGEFIHLDRADLITLTGEEVLGAVQRGLGGVAATLSVQLRVIRDDAFVIELVSERLTGRVVGDTILGGIHVEHSFLGRHATQIMSYLLRQVCVNGMTRRECVKARRIPRTRRLESTPDNRDRQIEQIQRLTEEAVKTIEPTLCAIGKLRDKALKDVSAVNRLIEQFLRNARMASQNMNRLLRLAWEKEMGGNRELSYYGVLNALTWLATHSRNLDETQLAAIELKTEDLPSELQTARLFRLSGVFANQANHLCPECFLAMAA